MANACVMNYLMSVVQPRGQNWNRYPPLSFFFIRLRHFDTPPQSKVTSSKKDIKSKYFNAIPVSSYFYPPDL